LPVILFHAGLPGFSGGFLGVDIFFVISGYLITSILLREAEAGTFSIVAFYNRRVRRIFPALFVMLFLVTAAAALVLAPIAFKQYARSLVATALFASNFLFFLQVGYFDTNALDKPLLHTWSLAVEEQFYLVWPLLLATCFRLNLRRYLLAILCAGVLLSYAICVLWPNPAGVFYLPVTRAWELGLGAILAVRPTRLPASLSVAALLAILVSIAAFDAHTPMFIASGVACGGSAILICTEGGPANRALALAPCVGIGLISYSLYLWHWPLLALANYAYFEAPPVGLRVALLLAAGLAAFLSYRFVERPFRRKGSARKAFTASAVTVAVLIGLGVSIEATNGFPLRYGRQVAAAETQFTEMKKCDGCRIGQGPVEVVLWGDSYAMAQQAAIADFAAKHRVSAIVFSRVACPSLFGAQQAGDGGCAAFHEHVAASIAKLDPKLIVLTTRWDTITETTAFGTALAPPYYLVDAKSRRLSTAESRRVLHEALMRTVSMLSAEHPKALIVLVGQAPVLGTDPERCMIAEIKKGQCSRVRDGALQRVQYSNGLIAEASQRFPNVRPVFLSRVLCSGTRCPTRIGNIFVYRDDNHLSDWGAKLLLEPSLSRIWSAG
jgi:peptidoglycan/LPS O-acetylase OafA/YrhL